MWNNEREAMQKEKKFVEIDTIEKAVAIATWLTEKKAADVLALDVRGVCVLSEAQVLATARGLRHTQALADHLLERLGSERFEFLGMEGYKAGLWILMDCNDVVVHIFQEENRSYFNLEGLWTGSPIVFQQAAAPVVESFDGDLDA